MMSVSEFFASLNHYVNVVDDAIWGHYLIVLLLVIGLYYSIRLKFPQITLAKYALQVITEKDPNAKNNKHHISPYEALMISMGTRVGMGTIVGMAVAVVAGGPGAIVWLWVAAFFNGAISVAENTLGQVYKSRDGGTFKGGPAYYMLKGLGSKKLAIIYSVVMILIGWSFTGLYSYTIYSSFIDMPAAAASQHLSVYVGLVLAIFAAIMFFGGGRYIAKFTSYVTPFMAAGFIIITIVSIIMHYEKAGMVIRQVFASAFDLSSILGGFAGSVLVIGIKRGLFSNEAGLGSVPCAAASAQTNHPVNQGIVQGFCVLVDTLIATLAVFFVLFSDSYSNAVTDSNGERLTAMPLIQAAMREVLGTFGDYYVTLLIIVLTFTVIVGAYYVGQMNVKYIRDNRLLVNLYRIITILVVYAGAQASLTLAWGMANVVMGLGATMNIVAVLLLSKVVTTALADYRTQRSQGQNPVFSAKKLGINNADCWD